MATDEHNNLYLLLANKSIYSILIGDTELGESASMPSRKMPYLSGPDIVALSNDFGLPATYGQGAQSRWMFMDDLYRYAVAKGRVSDLLTYLFNSPAFSEHLLAQRISSLPDARTEIVNAALDAINLTLALGGHELRCVNGRYDLFDVSGHFAVDAPVIKSLDVDYITDMHNRAIADVENGVFDEALAKARTLLEETFIHSLEYLGITDYPHGDIQGLFKKVKAEYNMNTDPSQDKRINSLLSGLNTIVSSVTEMRNAASDAHGHGSNRINIKGYHARLVVNSAAALSEFVLSMQLESSQRRKSAPEP